MSRMSLKENNNNNIITNMTTVLILLSPYYNMMTPLICLFLSNSSCIHSVDGKWDIWYIDDDFLVRLSPRQTNLMNP